MRQYARTINLWDIATHEKVATLIDPIGYTKSTKKSVESVTFSRDGETIASSHEARKVRFWNVFTHEITTTIDGLDLPVLELAYSPDGTLLAGGTANWTTEGKVKMWSATSRTEIATLTAPLRDKTSVGSGLPNYVNSVTFSPDGKTVAGAIATDDLIVRWDVATREVIDVLDARSTKTEPLQIRRDSVLTAQILHRHTPRPGGPMEAAMKGEQFESEASVKP